MCVYVCRYVVHEGAREGRIAFYNELVGEFWYKLELTGEHTPPTVLSEMQAPVGGSTVRSCSVCLSLSLTDMWRGTDTTCDD